MLNKKELKSQIKRNQNSRRRGFIFEQESFYTRSQVSSNQTLSLENSPRAKQKTQNSLETSTHRNKHYKSQSRISLEGSFFQKTTQQVQESVVEIPLMNFSLLLDDAITHLLRLSKYAPKSLQIEEIIPINALEKASEQLNILMVEERNRCTKR